MTSKTHSRSIGIAALTLLLAGIPIAGRATVVTLEYGSTFEIGGAIYPGTGPFLKATLSDNGPGSTSVHFVLEPFNLAEGDYVRTWAFNFSGSAKKLEMESISKTGAFDTPKFSAPSSNLGGGNPPFSFSLDFATSNKKNGIHRFTEGESLAFDLALDGCGTVTVEDFLGTLNFKGQDLVSGVFFAGASGSFHYKGEEIPVPEPAAVIFGGVMAIGLIGAEFRRRST